jgi:C-terminal processing protease CtpA/Prc
VLSRPPGRGLVVTSVYVGDEAHRHGVQCDDELLSINGIEYARHDEATAALSYATRCKTDVVLEVSRVSSRARGVGRPFLWNCLCCFLLR